ncbi:MAG TPA: biotin transporter BioY [Bacillota bacterium]|nr:biotin transporter BioY [Bacillota bacterium]HOG52311.1 biotin transporter BioY [Bacillota bacterium]
MGLSTGKLTVVALFTALMIAGAYISVPLAGTVPLTFQPFVSILAGAVIGPRLGFLAVAAYVAIGLAGVPVFAGFTGGIVKVLSPSFGFILGFLAATVVTGAIAYKGKPSFPKLLAASVAGIAAIYLAGIPYMHMILVTVSGKDWAFAATALSMAPFFVKDMLLAGVAALIAARLLPIARRLMR